MSQLERLHTLKLQGKLHSIPDTVRCLTSLKLLDVSNYKLRRASGLQLKKLRCTVPALHPRLLQLL